MIQAPNPGLLLIIAAVLIFVTPLFMQKREGDLSDESFIRMLMKMDLRQIFLMRGMMLSAFIFLSMGVILLTLS